jgi:hypothetical protein
MRLGREAMLRFIVRVQMIRTYVSLVKSVPIVNF